MSKANRKTTTAISDDAALISAYRKFDLAHAAMRAANTEASDAGTVRGCTPEQKRAANDWNRRVDKAFRLARAVLECPASTLRGMLLKIKVAGFTSEWNPPEYSKGPLKGTLAALESWSTPQHSEGDDAIALILSLRGDIRRILGEAVRS